MPVGIRRCVDAEQVSAEGVNEPFERSLLVGIQAAGAAGVAENHHPGLCEIGFVEQAAVTVLEDDKVVFLSDLLEHRQRQIRSLMIKSGCLSVMNERILGG